MIRVRDWWNRIQVVRQDVNIYNIIILIIIKKSEIKVKPDESKYGKTSSTNSVYGFMRQVRQRNNPHKKP